MVTNYLLVCVTELSEFVNLRLDYGSRFLGIDINSCLSTYGQKIFFDNNRTGLEEVHDRFRHCVGFGGIERVIGAVVVVIFVGVIFVVVGLCGG